MLRVSVLGNLGADAELRYSQKGAPIAAFRMAVGQTRSLPDGERQETTEWFSVRAMGRLAEYAQRLTKGTRVLVVGRLEIVRFQSRDGEPRVGFDVWADEVVNLSTRLPEAADDSAVEASDVVVALPTGGAGRGTAERVRTPVGASSTPPSRGMPPAAGRRPLPGSVEDDLEAVPF